MGPTIPKALHPQASHGVPCESIPVWRRGGVIVLFVGLAFCGACHDNSPMEDQHQECGGAAAIEDAHTIVLGEPSEEQLRKIAGFELVRVLRIYNFAGDGEFLGDCIGRIRSLEELHLVSCVGISEETFQRLELLKLRRVSLYNCVSMRAPYLMHLNGGQVEMLDLRKCSAVSADLGTVIQNWSSLLELRVEFTSISPSEARVIQSSLKIPNVDIVEHAE